MTVTAVDPVVGDVVLVTEWNRLVYGSADVGDVGRPDIQLEDCEQESESE